MHVGRDHAPAGSEHSAELGIDRHEVFDMGQRETADDQVYGGGFDR